VWFVTEPVTSLALDLDDASDESKVYGLLHVCTALAFLNRDGQSVHGGLRMTSVWVTPGGEWKLGGMEVVTRLDEADGAMWVRPPFSLLLRDRSIDAERLALTRLHAHAELRRPRARLEDACEPRGAQGRLDRPQAVRPASL